MGEQFCRHMDHVHKRLAAPQFDWDTTPLPDDPVTISPPSNDATVSPPEDRVVTPPSEPTPRPTDPPQRRYLVRKRVQPDWYVPS